MVFPLVMYGCKSWTIKKAEYWRIDAFRQWCWKKLLRIPLTSRRSNQWILKKINSEYSLERLMLKLKLWYLSAWCKELTHCKRHWCWERLRAKGERVDRGWDGWMASSINGLEFEQTPGASEGQGSLVCCSPWDHKVLDTTEQLKNNNLVNFLLSLFE